MDRWQALHNFWRSFGIPAYDENTVPEGEKMPYITYELATGSFNDGDVPLTASIWYFDKGWGDISRKADEISEYIGFGGVTLPTDTGYLWIKRRTPFAQRMSDTNDNIRRVLLSISVEYFTT